MYKSRCSLPCRQSTDEAPDLLSVHVCQRSSTPPTALSATTAKSSAHNNLQRMSFVLVHLLITTGITDLSLFVFMSQRQASDVGNRVTANVPLSNPVDSLSDVTAPGGLLREPLQGRNVIWVGNPVSAFGSQFKA